MSKNDLQIRIIAVSGGLTALQITSSMLAQEIKKLENQTNQNLHNIKKLLDNKAFKCANLLAEYFEKPTHSTQRSKTSSTQSKEKVKTEAEAVENAIAAIVYFIGSFKNLNTANRKLAYLIRNKNRKSEAVSELLGPPEDPTEVLINTLSKEPIQTLVTEKEAISQEIDVISDKINALLDGIISPNYRLISSSYHFTWAALLLQQAQEIRDRTIDRQYSEDSAYIQLVKKMQQLVDTEITASDTSTSNYKDFLRYMAGTFPKTQSLDMKAVPQTPLTASEISPSHSVSSSTSSLLPSVSASPSISSPEQPKPSTTVSSPPNKGASPAIQALQDQLKNLKLGIFSPIKISQETPAVDNKKEESNNKQLELTHDVLSRASMSMLHKRKKQTQVKFKKLITPAPAR